MACPRPFKVKLIGASSFMPTRPNRHVLLLFGSVLLVGLTCLSLNIRTDVQREDGSALFVIPKVLRPIRIERGVGWPEHFWVRTNWATIESGDVFFDEEMRPKESRVVPTAIAINIAVAVVLSITACLLVSAGYRRQFSLQSFLAFASCVAVLIFLL